MSEIKWQWQKIWLEKISALKAENRRMKSRLGVIGRMSEGKFSDYEKALEEDAKEMRDLRAENKRLRDAYETAYFDGVNSGLDAQKKLDEDEIRRLRELLGCHISFISAVALNRNSLEYDAITLGIHAMDFLISTEGARRAAMDGK